MSESLDLVKIPIAEIRVGDRFRKEMGDLEQLADSIAKQGLLQPIGITADHELVFGERRLRASRDVLGLTEIEARIVDVTSIVEGEHDENQVRKNFTLSEQAAIGRAVALQLEERRGRPKNGDASPTFPAGRTRDIAAKKAGFSSGRTFERVNKVTERGTSELVDAMDRGDISPFEAEKLSTLEPEHQTNVVQLKPVDRTKYYNAHNLKKKMDAGLVKRVQSVQMGFEMVDDANVTASQFLDDALPRQIENLTERAPRLISLLEGILKGGCHEKNVAR